MPDFLQGLLGAQPFMPHGFCLRWDPVLVTLLIVANMGIAVEYFSIPAALFFFVRKRAGDLPYRWMFLMFAGFIIACGMTHIMFVLTLYRPIYWLEAAVDVWTALISLATAALLWPLIPKALSLRSPEALEEVNNQLIQENEHRKLAEAKTKRQNEFLQLVLDTMSDGVVVANDKAKLIAFNSAAEKLLGQGRANISPEKGPEP